MTAVYHSVPNLIIIFLFNIGIEMFPIHSEQNATAFLLLPAIWRQYFGAAPCTADFSSESAKLYAIT